MDGLESAHGYLQRRVASELRLKNTPTLQFLYDDSLDRGLRIARAPRGGGRVVSRENGAAASRQLLLDELRGHEKFLLTTHERPDGDAVGSLAAMQQVLAALGKDALAFVAADEFPLPYEYRFIQLEGLVSEPPDDLCSRVLVFLDCGNIDRTPADDLKHEDHRILNIDHHHDNTRFGTINHVDAGRLVHGGDGVGPDAGPRRGADAGRSPRRCTSGLVTDTGRFMYENTGPRAHEMASELMRQGVDAHAIYRRLYEGIPQGKLELLARGLSHVERYDGGLLTVTHLTLEDYRSTGADESYSEGVVDHLRSVEGTVVAGLVRDQLGDETPARKVSLRATDDRVDVSRIARALGGGGHRRAAGFSTDLDFPELVEVLREQLALQL